MTSTSTPAATTQQTLRCAVYCRKSTEDGLDMEFNSLDAQREACEAYILSQRHEGWTLLPNDYSDGGFTGANTERPALQRMLEDIRSGKVDVVVTYKVDRLSRSLLDFAKLMELFEVRDVSFVSVTQNFSTTTAIGKLTLNILMSFAEFERAIISERVRDKIAGAKRKGKYTGGTPLLGYDPDPLTHKLIVNDDEAKTILRIFKRYAETGSGLGVARELNAAGTTTKSWTTRKGTIRPGKPWSAPHIYRLLNNRTYVGEIAHKDKFYRGEHEAIVSRKLWERVQTMLKSNPPKKQLGHENVPALLKGVIRCGHCGCAMTGTYTRKGERIYRYYLCTKAGKNGYSMCPVKLVPAGDIEAAVVEQIRRIIKSPEMIAQTYLASSDLDSAATTRWEVTDALQQFDPIWNELYPAERRMIVGALVESVSVNEDGLDVRMQTNGLHSMLSLLGDTRAAYDERSAQ